MDLSALEPHIIELLGRYAGAGVALGLGGIGAAVGMGMAAGQADEAIMRQPSKHGQILRTMLIGQAVGGSPSIFALVVGLLVLFLPANDPTAVSGNFFAILLGTGLAIGFGCFGSGLGCGWPAGSACDGVARNPRQGTLITSRMIIGQAVAQSPAIFATVIALILLFQKLNSNPGFSWDVIGVTLGAGLAIGAGSLGSGVGSGITARGAMDGISRFPQNHGLAFRTMLVSQGLCGSPSIFAVLVAFIMLFTSVVDPGFVGFSKAFAAGIAVGFGGIGPGIGSGIVGDSACLQTAIYPRQEPLLLRTMLTGQAVTQSTAIYSLIIALVILYVV